MRLYILQKILVALHKKIEVIFTGGAFRVRCVNFWERDHHTTVESTTASVGLSVFVA